MAYELVLPIHPLADSLELARLREVAEELAADRGGRLADEPPLFLEDYRARSATGGPVVYPLAVSWRVIPIGEE